jgi:hypothetical protein
MMVSSTAPARTAPVLGFLIKYVNRFSKDELRTWISAVHAALEILSSSSNGMLQTTEY